MLVFFSVKHHRHQSSKMTAKTMIIAFFALAAFASSSAGIVPVPAAYHAAYVGAPAAYVAPYASTYNAHVVNHAIAAPVAAAPVVAAHAAYPYAPFAEPLVYAK